MKLHRRIIIYFAALLVFLISSCGTNKVNSEPVEEPQAPEQIEQTEPVELEEEEQTEEIEEPETYNEDDEVEYVEEVDLEEEEYLRSINNLNEEELVTKQQFNDDKAAILKIIEELSKVMATKDYKKWLTYIEPDSINYYSNPVNLRNAQKKLPNKAIALRNIEDYFNYVFIPSRKRSRVDEIRYISTTNIKAVQVKEDYSTVVYYYFKKINGKWYVHLPPV